MKRIALLVNVVVVTVLLLAACGATPEPSEPSAEGTKIILRVGTGDSGEGLNPHQRSLRGSRRRTLTS